MLKPIISLALLLGWFSCLQAQEMDETPVISPVVKKSSMVDKIDFNLSAGSSFLYSKDFGSGLSNYVAPELTYKLAPKVRLNVGVMLISSNVAVNRYRTFYNEQSVVIKNKPVTSVLAYVSGDYLVNDRLTISGMLLRDLNSPQGFGTNSYNPSVQAMSLHLDYKLTDHITIGGGVHMNQGGNWGYGSNYGLFPSNYVSPLYNY